MALASLAVLGAMGLCIDLGMVFIEKAATQGAVDAAALATAQSLDGTADGEARGLAAAAALDNRTGFGARTVPITIEFQTDTSGKERCARASATVRSPLYFGPAVGSARFMDVNATAVACQQ